MDALNFLKCKPRAKQIDWKKKKMIDSFAFFFGRNRILFDPKIFPRIFSMSKNLFPVFSINQSINRPLCPFQYPIEKINFHLSCGIAILSRRPMKNLILLVSKQLPSYIFHLSTKCD